MGRTEFEAREPVAAARELLAATADEPVYALDQPVTTTSAVVRAAYEDGGPPLRIVAPREELVTFRNQFPDAARAASLVVDDRLTIRAHDGTNLTPMFVTSESVQVLLAVEDAAAVGERDSGSFVADAPATAERAWTNADSFELRAPPLDRITRAMTESFGEAFRIDFEAALAAADRTESTAADDSGVDTVDDSGVDTTDGSAGAVLDSPAAFDEVGVTLAVAAKHEQLYNEVSRWGDDAGIASEATFSRRKRRLEEAGVLDTEKQPIDMGRPRQRLVLAPDAAERLDRAGVAGLVALVAESTG